MPEITDPALLQQLNSGPTQRPPRPSGPQPITLGRPDPKLPGQLEGQRLDNESKRRDADLDAVNIRLKQIELSQKERELAQAVANNGDVKDIQAKARRMVELARSLKQSSANDWFATGFGNIPARYIPGTPAYDVTQNVQTIQGDSALEKLAQIRANSPTGGNPFGNMSNADMELLKASVAALDPGQSDARFQSNLDYIIQLYSKLLPENEQQKEPVAQADQPQTPDWSLAGTGGGDGAQLTSEGKWQDDPALRGVNSRVSQMIKSGASAGQVRAYLDSVQPGLGARTQNIEDWVRFSNQHPQAKINVDLERAWVPSSGWTKTLGEAGQTSGGQALISYADALSAGNLDSLTDSPAATRAAMAANAANSPTADFLGGLAGNFVGTAGVGKALGMFGRGAQWARSPALADLVYGGAYGAGSADEGSRLTGALTGAAENYLGAKAGQKAGSALGSSLTGVTDPAVQYLNRMGVRMTPGQMAGGRLKSMEDRWTGNSGLGDKINDLRRRSITDWNEALYRDAYAPVGYTPTATGEAGVTAGRGAVSDFYNRTLDPVSVTADQPFMAGLSQIKQAGANIPGDLAGEIDNTLKTRVGPFIDPQTGQITGRNYQAIRQGVQGDMSDFSGAPRYDLYRDQAGNILDELDDLFRRQSPGTTEALGKANEAWRNNSILEDAVIAARNNDGIIMPSQLGNAVVSNAKKYGGKGLAASEDRPFFELQRAGQNVLPSKVPDSGTAGRAREGSALAKASGMAMDALRSPLYSETLEPLFRAGLLDRPQFMIDAGEKVKRYSRLPGMFGGALALQWLNQ